MNDSIDQMRHVDETKSKISEMKTPRKIKVMRNFTILVFILGFTGIILEFMVKKSYFGQLDRAIDFTITLESRAPLMFDVRYIMRKYEIIAK